MEPIKLWSPHYQRRRVLPQTASKSTICFENGPGCIHILGVEVSLNTMHCWCSKTTNGPSTEPPFLFKHTLQNEGHPADPRQCTCCQPNMLLPCNALAAGHQWLLLHHPHPCNPHGGSWTRPLSSLICGDIVVHAVKGHQGRVQALEGFQRYMSPLHGAHASAIL